MRVRRVAVLTAVGLVVASLTGVILALTLDIGPRRGLDDALAAWQALGGKPTLLDMKTQAIPDDENAAVLYEAAFARLQDPLGQDQQILARIDENLEPRDALMKFAEIIEMTHAAAARDRCQWDTDYYEKGIQADLSYLGRLRDLARLIAAEARQAAKEGRVNDASRAIVTLLRMARHAHAEPGIIPNMMLLAIQARAHEILENHLAHVTTPDDSLMRELISVDHRRLARAAMLADGAAGLQKVQSQKASQGMHVPGLDRELAKYVESVSKAVELISQPYWLRGESWTFLEEASASGLLGSMLVGAWDRMDQTVAIVETRQALAGAALALAGHRAAHGSYPDTFDIPIDPFTGKPLHYQREGDGFVIWSEGTMPGGDAERIEWRWK